MNSGLSRFLALTRKETAALFLLPAIHFTTAFVVLLDSFAFYLIVAKPGARAVFEDMATFMLMTSIILYPLMIMRSFADENADGTIENLLTAPISRFAIVMAKFSAAMVYVLLTFIPAVIYAALASYGGALDWHAALAGMLSLFFSAALAVALGLFISSLTISPIAAATATGLILIFMFIAADIEPYAGRLAAFVNGVSFVPHAKRWIAGELDTRGLVYFLSTTALFLFYAWLSVGVRGAGGRFTDRTARRRFIVTYLLVSAGIVLLVVQAAILHIKGFWEAGAPIFGAEMRRVPWPWLIPFGLSLAFFFWSLLTFRSARRAEQHNHPKRERKYATLTETQVLTAPKLYYDATRTARRRTLIAALAALAIVVNLNWLSRYPFRTFAASAVLYPLSSLKAKSWDVTRDKRNSLSASTYRTLDALQGQAYVYSFLAEDEDYQGVPLAEEIRRLLGRYSDYNGRVIASFADPASDPERAATLAKELEIPFERLAGSLVVQYQGRWLPVTSSSLAAPPDWRAQTAGDTRWVFDGEQGVTQALMRLLDPRVPNVYFTSGHRELSLAEGLWPERSASRFASALVMNNFRVHNLVLSPHHPVPPECDILIVAAPRAPLNAHETETIHEYLETGGRLLFIAPPPIPDYPMAERDPMNALVFELGGGYRDDLVEDAINNADGVRLHPLAKMRGAGEGDVRFFFPLTRSIRDNPRAPENGWAPERLFESYPSSAAMTPGGGQRLSGPFTLAYRSSKTTPAGEARVAVLASSRFAADSDIGRSANEAAIMSVAQWLAGREESYEIPPRPWTDRRIRLAGPSLRFVLWVGLVAPPLTWLLLGITVWWIRKD